MSISHIIIGGVVVAVVIAIIYWVFTDPVIEDDDCVEIIEERTTITETWTEKKD